MERSHERFRVEFGRECERAGSTTDAKKLSMFRVIMRFVGYPKVALISFMWLVQVSPALHRALWATCCVHLGSGDTPIFALWTGFNTNRGPT